MTYNEEVLWPSDRLYELVQRLAHGAGLSEAAHDLPRMSIDKQHVDISVKRAGRLAEVQVHPAILEYREIETNLRGLAPAVARVDRDGGVLFLGILTSCDREVTIIAPSGKERTVDPAQFRSMICHDLEASHEPLAQTVMRIAAVDKQDQARIRQSVLNKLLGKETLNNLWLLRAAPSLGLFRQIRAAGLGGRLALVISLYFFQSLLMVFSWWLVGKGALEGRLEPAVLIAWVLLLVTHVLVSATAAWWQGLLLLGSSGLYKRKILHGATKMETQHIRILGSGQLLGRVVETETLDVLAFSASINTVMALVDMVTVIGIFLLIPGITLLFGLYVGWVAFAAIRGWRLYQRMKHWAEMRIAMTNRIVEGLLGRRTRFVQEDLHHWHDKEDKELERYIQTSTALDGHQAAYEVIIRQGWLCLALLVAVPNLVSAGASAGWVAAVLGGIIMAFQAFTRFSESVQSLARLAVSWHQATLLYQSSQAVEQKGFPEIIEMEHVARRQRRQGEVLLEAHGLRFQHPGRNETVLENASITIRKGERILLEGPSGCGKSTLASLLCGLLTPSAGILLLNGFDIKTLGPQEWARRIAYAPQFKDNHLFTGTLAYNLLMGRRWPPTPQDLKEAEQVCHDLGLRPLLSKMPGGLHQIVGETGWKLSHGEQSRVFLARALLQDADVIILDESFGALDPNTMKRCMQTVFQRAPALIAIAHP